MARSDLDESPVVAVELTLGPAWSAVVSRVGARESLTQRIEQELLSVIEALGLPGRPRAEITLLPNGDVDDGEQLPRLRVNGRSCRFADDILLQAASYASRTPLGPYEVLRALPERLTQDGSPDDSATSTEQVGELLALTCRAAIGCQAHLLLTPAQVERYSVELASTAPLSPDRLRSILARIVDSGISVADRVAVRQVLAECLANGSTDDDIVEAVMNRLRPTDIELHVEPDLLRQLTIEYAADGPDLFVALRDELFNELGLSFPSFRFVPDRTLKPGSFCLRINHLTTMPRIGLAPDTVLVNDTVDRLRLFEIPAVPTTHPATQRPASLVDHGQKSSLDTLGYDSWDQMTYLAICLGAELRRAGWMLVQRAVTEDMLAQLGLLFPELERAARSLISLDTLTRILRALIAEGVSVRGLSRIVERLIEYELLGEADRPGDLLAFVRSDLADSLASTYARQTGTLTAYLVDPDIERTLASLAPGEATSWLSTSVDIDDETYARISSLIRQQLRSLPPMALVPVILTQDGVRSTVRSLLAQEFPRLVILAHGELPADFNVMLVSRIGA